jgi:hypothetical protein
MSHASAKLIAKKMCLLSPNLSIGQHEGSSENKFFVFPKFFDEFSEIGKENLILLLEIFRAGFEGSPEINNDPCIRRIFSSLVDMLESEVVKAESKIILPSLRDDDYFTKNEGNLFLAEYSNQQGFEGPRSAERYVHADDVVLRGCSIYSQGVMTREEIEYMDSSAEADYFIDFFNLNGVCAHGFSKRSFNIF